MNVTLGSVYLRNNGRWVAEYNVDGKRKYVYGKTENDVIDKRAKAINEINHVSVIARPSYSSKNEALLETKQLNFNLDFEEQMDYKREITYVAINKLTPFRGHPFSLYEGEQLDDMVASVKENGILTPIIVRRKETTLEILAGHNRVNAAKLAGIEKIPAIVLENVSDEDAMVYVVETNLLQRSFADMSHSEKAAVLALHHSKMFSQGKRNDILEQLKSLDNPHEHKENGTSSQIAKKLTSAEKIGETYNLSKDTVTRYIRINKLIPSLKSMLDKGGILFIAAYNLSFLNESEQMLLSECIRQNAFIVDIKKAEKLRELSEKRNLNSDNIYRILSSETKPKTNRTPTIKFKKGVYEKYFEPNQSTKEVQEIVEKALEMYFNRN